MHTILLVEDSSDMFTLTNRAFGAMVNVEWARTIGEATKLVGKRAYDLILLDVMLPDGDGFKLCSILQTHEQLKKIPIVFLTAKNTVSDKVLGFSVGATDFITKPFEPLELRARVESRLRRQDREKIEADVVRLGSVLIDKSTQKVKISDGGAEREIDLTPIEFKLLLFLAKEPNRVFSRNDVLNSVWGESVFVYNRSVDTHVSKLRKKLGPEAHYIESVHGSGYRLKLDEQKSDSRRYFTTVANHLSAPHRCR